MVGGGVHGKVVGIAHGTTAQVGTTIEGFHPFMDGYPQTGEMTTGIIVGEGIGGTINEYLTTKLNETGGTGKEVSIGRGNKLGVSKVCNPERDHNHNSVRKVHDTERDDRRNHNHKRKTTKKRKENK
jgi:hypothetical protein